MPDITITITDEQAVGLTSSNGGACPTDTEWLQAYLNPILNGWASQVTKDRDNVYLEAFKAAADTDTKADILASVNEEDAEVAISSK